MRKKTITALLTLVGAAVFLAGSPGMSGGPPDVPRVLDEHKKLLEKYHLEEPKKAEPEVEKIQRPEEVEKKENRERPDFGTWLKNLSLPLIVILIAILAVLFYFLFRGTGGMFPGLGRSPFDDFPGSGGGDESAADDTTGDRAYAIALERARSGELGNALVLLHKSSLRKLQHMRLVPPGDNYTNNQVTRILRENPGGGGTVTPFGELAAAAERSAFKGEEPAESTFLSLKTLYENTFLKIGNRKR